MRPTEKTRARDRPTDRANERIVNKWQHIHWQCTQAKTGRNNSDKEAAHNGDIERKRKLQQLQMKSEQRKIMKKRREREKKRQMRSREWISSKYKRQFFFLSVYCFESLCHFFSSLLGICVYVRFFFAHCCRCSCCCCCYCYCLFVSYRAVKCCGRNIFVCGYLCVGLNLLRCLVICVFFSVVHWQASAQKNE